MTQYTLFEHKRLFSVIFYRWNTVDQVRFHTHAFGAIAFLLRGWYHEKVRFGQHIVDNFVNVPLVPRLLHRGYCHAIGFAKPNTVTMVLAGPWDLHWWEYFPDTETWVKYAWGRKVVAKTREDPFD